MKAVIRVDASRDIGSGHVMRCLVLADALRTCGWEILFICRRHPGDLVDLVRSKDYKCRILEDPDEGFVVDGLDIDHEEPPHHISWLGVSWQQDAVETADILKETGRCDWLIVDHYALDWRWEQVMRDYVQSIMVIDDLSDRRHDCDVLMDQNCGDKQKHYQELVPPTCRCLFGPDFALVRPEFVEWRSRALERRKKTTAVRRILITFGGVDPGNLTGVVLKKLAHFPFHEDGIENIEIDIILGAGFSYQKKIERQIRQMKVKTNLAVAVDTMAEYMSRADLVIGAGGATVWEQCCLGLPGIVVAVSENQHVNATALEREGVGMFVSATLPTDEFSAALDQALNDEQWYRDTSARCGSLVDGLGTGKVVEVLDKEEGKN